MSYRAIRCYHSHKFNANKRGIKFNLTFDQWYDWWLNHGIDKNLPTANRNKRDELCMCRNLDSGPYELGNIYCDTRENNTRYGMTLRYQSSRPARMFLAHASPAGPPHSR
jgi:hypothetical protein